MGIEYLDGASTIPHDVDDWLDKWMVLNPKKDPTSDVVSLRVGLKGILITCVYYKAFIFKNTDTYRHVKELIPDWLVPDSTHPLLIITGDKNGKPRLGIDRDIALCWWTGTEVYLEQQQDNGTGSDRRTQKRTKQNPLSK